MVELVFAKLHREVNHKCPSNGQIEKCEHSVQPQDWRAKRERAGKNTVGAGF